MNRKRRIKNCHKYVFLWQDGSDNYYKEKYLLQEKYLWQDRTNEFHGWVVCSSGDAHPKAAMNSNPNPGNLENKIFGFIISNKTMISKPLFPQNSGQKC